MISLNVSVTRMREDFSLIYHGRRRHLKEQSTVSETNIVSHGAKLMRNSEIFNVFGKLGMYRKSLNIEP